MSDTLSIVSIIVSSMSAAFTGGALYYAHRSPFKLWLLTGNPGWRREKIADREILTLTLPIIFTNVGAQTGQVKDMIAEVVARGARFYFQPRFFASRARYADAASRQKSSFETSESEFHPFFLSGRECADRIVVFTPLQQNAHPTLAEHTITLHIMTSSSHRKAQACRVVLTIGTFQIPPQAIQGLENGMTIHANSTELRRERDSIVHG
jgi:hypothetical protein